MTLDEYRKHVLRLAEENNGEAIFNGSSDHAAIVAEIMFQQAKQNVSILSNEFDPCVYEKPDLIREATQFLSDSHNQLRMLIETDTDDAKISKHPFLRVMRYYPNAILRRVAPDQLDDYDYNFMVVDDNAIRFESDRDDHNALVAFGRENDADYLLSAFQDIWDNHSEPVIWHFDDHLQNNQLEAVAS